METSEREHACQGFNIKKGIKKTGVNPEGTSDHRHSNTRGADTNGLVSGSSVNRRKNTVENA